VTGFTRSGARSLRRFRRTLGARVRRPRRLGLGIRRQQIAQSSGAAVMLAFLLGQCAVVAIAWGHAVKLCGLVEIARDVNRTR